MVIIPILLALFTGLLILWIFDQHKFLNIFEQIVLGFVSALSLFVLELFLGGMIFQKLFLIGPIITFLIFLGLFIYKSKKNKKYLEEIKTSIKDNFTDIGKQFLSLKSWKKYLVIAIGIHVLIKLFMVLQINTNMPTFDEDAVAGRDLKTKIFAENKSLVLDKTSSEYFGLDYGRYPFAALTDTYFLLPYGKFVNGLSNIISPLIYLLSVLLLFGIFLRKSNLLFAALSSYIFVSLPFVFIHGFGSYRNFPSGFFLFLFVFYLVDQLFHLDKEYGENKRIIVPIIFVSFISSVTRNEGTMLTGISFLAVIVLYHIFKKQKLNELKNQFWPIIPIIFAYILNKIIFSFYPQGAVLNTGGTQLNSDLFNSFFTNIREPGVFIAPFKQMFFHPDYILLFYLFVLSIILFIRKYKKTKELRILFAVVIILILIFLFVLYSNMNLGLVTHFAFIRYPVSIIMFLIFFIGYILYINHENKES